MGRNRTLVDEEINLLIRARYPILYIVSWEEDRVLRRIQEIAEGERGFKIVIWRISQGFVDLGKAKQQESITDPIGALDSILNFSENAVFVFCDFHHFMGETNPVVIRKLRDVASAFEISRRTLVILSPVLAIPAELEKDITVLDYPLPNQEQLGELLEEIIERVRANPRIKVDLDEEAKEQLLKAALGLTARETERVFAKAIVKDGRLDGQDVEHILKEKEQIIRKSGILEYFSSAEQFQDIGGLNELKQWLRKRAYSFSDEARQYGLPEPKGILLIGVPGCGKSLVAKAVAAEWQKPLLRLDIGSIFGGLVGASEENIRRAIRVAESVAPAILWLDEIEKGFVSAQSGGDSGVTARVFSTLITWMQEKTKPVFVVATANDVSQLPPELLRKGRFDEIFFVDLPSGKERKEIFRIHLKKHGRDLDEHKIEELAREAEGFSGAEIEQVIVSSLYDAFELKKTLGSERSDLNEIILKNIRDTIPLARAMKTKVNALRQWASIRARVASSRSAEESLEKTQDEKARQPQPRLRITLPFHSGERARTLKQLIELSEKYPEEATGYLYDRRLEDWLRQNGLAELAEKVSEHRQSEHKDYAFQLFLEEAKAYQEEGIN